MNIFELRDHHTITKTGFKPSGRFIAAGYQAQVYQHPRDPNKIIKLVDIKNLDGDAYFEFIKFIMDHQDNIHFPRIFNAKLYEKQSDAPNYKHSPFHLIVIMEKLHEVSNPKLHDAVFSAFRNAGFPAEVIEDSFQNHTKLHSYIDSYVDDTTVAKNSHLDEFISAMKLLQPFIDEHGQDMSMNNFMLRLTSTGPQLVIIDPLAPS